MSHNDWDRDTIYGRSTGSFKDKLYRITSPLDFIDKLEGVVASLVWALTRRKKKRNVVVSIAQTAIGANAPLLFFSREARSGLDVERMLWDYGIPIAGRRVTNELTAGFLVPIQQRYWATYLVHIYTNGMTKGDVDRKAVQAAQKRLLSGKGMPRPWKHKKGQRVAQKMTKEEQESWSKVSKKDSKKSSAVSRKKSRL